MQIVGRTHDEEKLAALRNAALNVLVGDAVEDLYLPLLLRLVDELTPPHVRLLSYVADPASWYDDRGIERVHYETAAPIELMRKALPDLASDEDLFMLLCRDLDNRGLARTDSTISNSVSENSVYASRATPLGLTFVAFIAPPW